MARECIANKVRLLSRAVTAIYDEALRPHELTINQMSVLVTVAVLDAPSPGAVGRRLHMEKSTVSRNVERMRSRGWLEIVAGEGGRGQRLRLTAAGQRLLRQAHPAWERAQERAAKLLGGGAVRGVAQTTAWLSRSLGSAD